MAKRKLAGSIRRYVAARLSRLTKGVAGVFRNGEARQSPAEGLQPAAESLVNGHVPISHPEVLPVTKVPALDTIDQYAVEKTTEDLIDRSPRTEVTCNSDMRDAGDSLIQGYARFIASFTGLEDVAFVATRHAPFVSKSQLSRSIFCAAVAPSDESQGAPGKLVLREVDVKYHKENEVQFFAELGLNVSPENGRQAFPSRLKHAFTLFVETDPGKDVLQISFTYPRRLIPTSAVNQVLNTLALHLAESSPAFSISASRPELSVLNFPPLMIPPRRHKSPNDDINNCGPESHFLHAAFESWARKSSNATALDFVHSLQSETSLAKHSTLTYAALDTAASNLAAYIRSLLSESGFSAEQGRIIPVNMSTSPELYISYLGILKAGHAFCPIPQDAPAERVREILRDVASPIILGNISEPSAELRHANGTVYETTSPIWVNVAEVSKWKKLEGDSPILDAPIKSPLEHIDIKENQTAYLLFTSGSTGKPKGVQVSHLASACSIASHATTIPLPGESVDGFRWFQFASPSFDPSIMEIFVTLSTGATLCSADRSITLANLEDTINEARATIMMATPSLASLLRPDRLKTLESLWSMGEKLNRTVIDNFARRGDISGGDTSLESSMMLVNAYGPTEGAINCTFVAPFKHNMRGSIIGKALPTCAMFILCPSSFVPKLVPTGTVGELAIGGPQVSKGYLNRPNDTAKAFVHSNEFGHLYRTGDKARIVWDESGSQVIEYLGRISTDQVKVNGRRVELGEIESVIATVPRVVEVVAVVLKKDAKVDGSEQIVACIVANDASDEQKMAIVHQAQKNATQHLIPSMCPAAYTFLESLPRSSSGKVDRRAISLHLQQKENDGIEIAHPHENGYTQRQAVAWEKIDDEDSLSLQHLVIRLIAETTDEDVSAIKPGKDLYSMGMDSLGAMRFLQRLKEHGIGSLTVSDILQSQTSEALVNFILRYRGNQDAKLSEARQDEDSKDSFRSSLESFMDRNHSLCAKKLGVAADMISQVLPTTATQSGMLTSFLRSLADESYMKRTYIYHSVLALEPHVNVESLKKAWESVISSYDSFRTMFCMVDDEMAPFAQCILAPEKASKIVWDIYTVPDEGSSEEVVDRALQDAERSINLDNAPWKLSLVESSERSHIVLSMFHGIFDGGSLQLLLEDVSSAYSGQSLARRISLNHIVKHHFQAYNPSTSDFWTKYLGDYTPVAFPSVTPHRTPTKKNTECVEITSLLSHDTLKKRSRSLGSTPLSVLQAAWCAVLLSYTGTPDQDVVMGSVVSGRLDKDSEVCIGPTFSITPSRVSVKQMRGTNDTLTNRSVVRHLASFNAKALLHLQPRLGSVTAADGQIPYDTVLAYQDFGCGSKTSQLWSSIRHPPMANDFSVMVEIIPEADSSLTLRASFDTKLDAASAEMMLKQMDDIVRYILEEPNRSFEDAPMQIRSDLKSTFNSQSVVAPEVGEGLLLHSQFEKHALSHPDDLALIFKRDLDNEGDPGNLSLTYGELNSMADNLADHLVQVCGQLADASVPLCIEKSPALYVAILAVLKAGGAWCPIDTLSPAQRRHDLIARTSAGVLLISELDGREPEDAVPAGVKVIDVSQFTERVSASQRRPFTRHRATPDNMAYLIWTSGTTGAPKGVPITHSAAVSSMKSLQTDIPGNDDDSPVRCLQFSQPTFDVSIQDFFYTWGLGGVLIAGTREIMLDSFSRLANMTNATHAHLTPAFAAGVPRESCKTLKVITMIGEKLTQPVADDWGTNMRAFNTYGPAEVTVVSTIREFGNEHKCVKSANIGWPMKTVSVFVMKNQRMVMKNAIGELALGGPQLSPGYLNQEDVTKAKYIWNEEAGQKLYYTGDLVRMLSDGSLEYVTRVDDLVKIGGIRIELSEISFALRGCHSLVENIETLVLSRTDRPTQVIVAFLCAPKAAHDKELLVLQDTAIEIARAASDQARNVLPEHMIPSVYLVVRTLPKTPSAKLDRRALQAAYASVDLDSWESKLDPEDIVSHPDSELDASIVTQVVDIIASLVGIEPSVITKSNRLRSLGVDSIRATRLAFRLKEVGHNLTVMDVLSCVTVQDLVKLVVSSNTVSRVVSRKFDVNAFDEIWHGAVAAQVQDDFITVRTTAIQESLLTETMGTYNMYWSNHFFMLDRSVDVARLRQAWFAVCQKTEALRTGFIPVVGTRNWKPDENLDFSILQLIYKLPALDWEYHDCTQQAWRDLLENRIEDVMTRHQKNYFRHPPWAVTVFDKGHERIMVLTVHHCVHDEPSLRFIMEDVRSAYAYKPPLRGQLSDALSVVLANVDKYIETVQFWESELKGYAELDAPVWPDLTGKRVPPGVTPEYRLISEEIPLTESVAKLQSTAASMGLQSIGSIIRAAWAYVSLSYLGLPATVFAETLSDRVLDTSLERSVGPLITVVPIPFHPKGSAREVLMEQNRLAVQSWKHRYIHARDVRRVLQRPRGSTLYPAVFNFHVANDSSENNSLPDLWLELEDQIGLHVEHPMAMNVFQRSNGSLILEASSDSRLINRDHLRLFVRQIDGLITSILACPDEPLPSLVNRLPPGLRAISDRLVSKEVADSIHKAPTYWLEQFAESHPGWTAVEVASSITTTGIRKEVMTYKELNAAANRVAAYISSFGYKNRIVAVCSGRTMASYPIIVGIFKSGNTYLPIDESLPADRKAFLIQDGDCPIVFTEASLSASFSGIPDSCHGECIDDPELQGSFAKMSSENQDYKSHPDDNAYLLFTSGSTGKPKGVMVTRANLSSFIESFSEFTCHAAPVTLKLGGTGRYLAQANRAFDPHLLEMFFPWRHGMATATAPRPMILDDLGLTLSKWEITHASFVPSLVDQSNITPEQCPKLKFMTVGGEKITQKVLDTWASAPNVAIVNAYGPTEVTIGCTFAHINESTNLRNIGPPLTASVAHVLVPGTTNYALRGQTGELCFTGNLVAKGYLNRPDATGFTVALDGTKMYRTGDIGRLMVDDSVEYLGRGDDQTKIRGQRLELGEVSEVLRSSSPVPVDVVTTVAKHPSLAKVQLISFVARSGGRHGKKDETVTFLYSDFSSLGRELQELCRRKLPAYMVPELILPISYIPLAPMSGKANIKELHGLFANLPLQTVLQGNNSVGENGVVYQRRLSPDEEVVVNEVCNVISADPTSFGPMTNIFEVGLDSLSAIGLSLRLRSIGYAATVASVMANPIIEQLARLPRDSSSSGPKDAESNLHQRWKELESQYRGAFSSDIELAQVASVRSCLPLQEGLVARSINSEQDQLYVNHVTLQLKDGIDGDKLRSAWQLITNDNEILRTSFASLEKEIVQVIFSEPSYQIQWTESEYSSLDAAINQRKLQQVQISRDIITNISTIPPVRFHLAMSSVDKRPLGLFIAMHHALYDGESLSMMLDDVATRYEGKQVPQRGSASAFLEHVHLQDTNKARQHWVQYMAGCYPTIFRSDATVVETTGSVHRTLSVKLSDLESRSATLKTTVPSLMQAIFALLLADFAGVSDVTYGLVLSGRTVSAPGAESVLLPCITTIPGRLNTKDLSTVADVVEAVQRSTVRSLDFQHTPLRKIQQWLKSETPLFDCLFSYIRSAAPPKHNLWKELDSDMPSEYPLAVEVQADHSANAVHTECIFSSAFGSLRQGEEFLEKMDAVLSAIISGEALFLDDFNLAQTEVSDSHIVATQWDNSSWSSTETKIRELTSTFCGLEPTTVSKGASFFSLGIDSVTAIQFARKLRNVGLQASSSDIMRFSCVGALAKRIDEASSKTQVNGVREEGRGAIAVETYGRHVRLLSDKDSISSMFESTPLQSGMITQTISAAGKVYVNPHPVRLNSSVDVERLKTALREVIQLNNILRTSFHIIGGFESWIAAVHANPPFEWTEISLPSGVNVLSDVMSLFSFTEESSFEVPPLRSVLVNQPEDRTLVIIIHHALYDGASLPFVFEDLATVYAGESPAKRPQFSEMVGYVLDGQGKSSDFWTSRLQGYEAAEIPPLNTPQTSDCMFTSEHRIDLDLTKITESCKEMEVTIQSISLLAYAKVYARVIGRRDLVLGQVLAGRSLPAPEGDRTIGPLFNTVPQRVTFEPKFLSNKALAQRLQQQTTDAQIHQHAPLRIIQNTLRQANQLGASQLFDSLFVFQKSAAFTGSVLDNQNIWTPYETEDYTVDAEYKLNVEVDHGHDGITVSASCNGRYISQQMLDNILHDFGVVFRDIVEHPTRCSTALPDGLGELPLRRHQVTSQDHVAEDSEVPVYEAVIRSVLAEVTGISVEDITPGTSIFNLGLDSLSAIRLASICRAKGLKATVGDILQGNTLRGISQRVRPMTTNAPQTNGSLIGDHDRVENEILAKLHLAKDSVETILPCLPGQYYHLAGWLKSGRKLYEPAWAFFSRERIDSERLRKAWLQLRQRHPVLRTCFAAISPAEAVQVVLKEAVDNSDTCRAVETSDSITEAAKAQAREEARRPSSLTTPPVRLRLLKAADRDGIMIIINHALYDAWTMPILVSELVHLYRGQPLNTDTNPDFPAFVDFALRSLNDLDEKTYWTSTLSPGSPTFIKRTSTEDPEPPTHQFIDAWEKVKNLSQMEAACRSAGLSVQAIILLAVGRCLAQLTGVQSPIMGLYQTGRSAPFNKIEKLTGPCLNVNPFVVPDAMAMNSPQSSIVAQARAIQTSLAERVAYEQSSLRNVLHWASTHTEMPQNTPPPDQTPAPLFNIWVNLLWMHNSTPTTHKSHLPPTAEPEPNNDTDGNTFRDEEDLFIPLPIGVPTDFIPIEPLTEPDSEAEFTPSTIDMLDTSFLPDENVFIDIGPDPRTDTIGFGIRVERGVMDQDEVRGLVDCIAGEIERVVLCLLTEG